MPCLVTFSIRLPVVTNVNAKDSFSACDNVQAVRSHQCLEGIGCLFFTPGHAIFHSEDGVRIYLRNFGTCVPNCMI